MARLVIFSDLHGNTPALEAFLAECEALQPDLVVNLGDIASGAVDPRGTLDLLATRPDIVTVRGNHERQLTTRASHVEGGSDWLAARVLTDTDRAWLSSLPTRVQLAPGVLAFHGSPDDDLTYLLETVDSAAPDGLREATDDEVRARLGPWIDTATVFVCGHTHLQRVRRLGPGLLVVNPGSLGWPAYEDDMPAAHRVEAGTPEARYLILDQDDGDPCGWRATPRTIAYPYAVAAHLALANGRPDVARALTTGRV